MSDEAGGDAGASGLREAYSFHCTTLGRDVPPGEAGLLMRMLAGTERRAQIVALAADRWGVLHQLDANAQLGGLEDGQLVVGGGVGPRGGGVGQGTGIGDGAQDLGQAAGPADLGHLLQHDPQLTAEGLDAHALSLALRLGQS